ncbi:putative E3 ubiquitin-protein ligase SINAT1 [Anoplophora glabripennis]|uniref:putative E3 ubiquitin-protein ligase SINAT1 n=1 Tax=Anoplophora glabripennis TaxID=217634 RepID=UPI0008742A2A|nr:putative E3 ubiquitin-protein ligase SINAT1 [Anoplophora glabripennis]
MKNQLMQYFECPVCLTYMLPPIFQCVVGHTVCAKCHFRLDRCPSCRGPLGGRALLVEILSSKMEFPCQYASDGCKISGRSYSIKTHEAGCQFSRRTCPLFKRRSCRWTGLLKDLVEHFTEKHPQHMFFEPEPKLMTFGMWQRKPRRNVSLFFVYDTIFLFCWKFNQYRDQLRFSLSYYGSPGTGKIFSYAICVLDGDNDREVLKMSAPCYSVMEDDVVRNQLFLSVHVQEVSSFFCAEGNLRFVLKIRNDDLISE